MEPDFEINISGEVSQEFLKRNIFSFQQAANFIQQLPYGRNTNKYRLVNLFLENRGTCSTKHAILKVLAEENDFPNLKLVLGLFKMNGTNTPAVSARLSRHNLNSLPEAHCYLKYHATILDYTKPEFLPAHYENDLIEEVEITPAQISDYKVAYHKNYLLSWLTKNPQLKLNPDILWAIREQCIQDLSLK